MKESLEFIVRFIGTGFSWRMDTSGRSLEVKHVFTTAWLRSTCHFILQAAFKVHLKYNKNTVGLRNTNFFCGLKIV